MKTVQKLVLFISIGLTLLHSGFAGDKLVVTPDRADHRYIVGEEAEFTLVAPTSCTTGVIQVRLDNFGSKVVCEAAWDVAKERSIKIRGALKEPGCLRVGLTGPDGKSWTGESVMVDPCKILPGAEDPKDFDGYWAAAKAKLAKEVPLDAKVERLEARCTKEFDFYRISFATFGRRVYGFMSVPKDASAAKKYPVVFNVPGAGLGNWSQDMEGAANEIRVTMTVYDWVPMWDNIPGAQKKYDAMNAAYHEKYGVEYYSQAGLSEGREAYYYYPVILGIDRVVDWVAAREDVDVNRFRYSGTSQGGMFGLYLTGLNKHITRAAVYVPAGCDWLGNVKYQRQAGWPQIVEAQREAAREATAKDAPYFDAANFARRIHVPIRFVCGTVDVTCAPASVWAAFNVCPSQDKDMAVGFEMGHGVFGKFYDENEAWLRANSAKEMERATPESQGVSSAAIQRWVKVCDKTMRLDSFMIVRHGKIIAEGWWAPFKKELPHILYSHSKSFTATAIGFLVDEGKLDLDDRVIKFFPDKLPEKVSENLRQLRVRDLLTMNTGTKLADRMRKTGELDWEKAFLANEFDYEPGTRYQYDSSATYMCAAIVERVTGKKLMAFLKEKLFDVIGIEKAWSTVSPSGVACGGWGMNMTTEEIARFGQWCLQEGRWGDRQVLASEWMRLMTGCETLSGWSGDYKRSDDDWKRGYGFQFWRGRKDSYRADGAYGQLTVVLPKKDVVISLTASTWDSRDELNRVWELLYPAFEEAPLKEDAAAVASLQKTCANLGLRTVAGEAKAKSAAAQKALKEKAKFQLKGEQKWLHLREASLEETKDGWNVSFLGECGRQVLPVGLGQWATGRIKFDNTPYESLKHFVGVHEAASSGAWTAANKFEVWTHFTDGVFNIKWMFTFNEDGTLALEYKLWGWEDGGDAKLVGTK